MSVSVTEMSSAQRCQGQDTTLYRAQQVLMEHDTRQVKHVCTSYIVYCVLHLYAYPMDLSSSTASLRRTILMVCTP